MQTPYTFLRTPPKRRNVPQVLMKPIIPKPLNPKTKEHLDSKPHGPMGVGIDVSFHKASHAVGLAEHAAWHAAMGFGVWDEARLGLGVWGSWSRVYSVGLGSRV